MPFQVCYRVRATRRNSPTEGEYVEMCERVWTINEMQVVKRWNIVAIRSQIIHRVMQNFINQIANEGLVSYTPRRHKLVVTATLTITGNKKAVVKYLT